MADVDEAMRCPALNNGTGERCELPVHHNSPHQAMQGQLTWEPVYVADLRREVARLKRDPWRLLLEDVLKDIGEELRSGSIDEAREQIKDAA
jgi:hypothetical protein